MPWLEITCRCGCERARRVYHQPSKPIPKFFSRECARVAPIGMVHKKWEFTPAMDATIRRVWLERKRGRYLSGVLKADPAFRGIPPYMIRHRARVLGVAALVDVAWTKAEDEIMEKWAGELSVEQIRKRLRAAGFRRSLASVGCRLYRRYQRSWLGRTYTALDVGHLLGWDMSVVLRWIDAGKLAAFRGGETGRRHRIHARDLAAFIRAEARELSQRRVDLEHVLELLAEYPEAPQRAPRPQRSGAVVQPA